MRTTTLDSRLVEKAEGWAALDTAGAQQLRGVARGRTREGVPRSPAPRSLHPRPVWRVLLSPDPKSWFNCCYLALGGCEVISHVQGRPSCFKIP